MTDLKNAVEVLILGETINVLRERVELLERGLKAIAAPSPFPLPAEAHALKSIAEAVLKGDVWA